MDTEISESQLRPILEGLIFTSGEEGLSLLQIQSVLNTFERSTISYHIELLRRDYAREDRGVELVHYGGRWKFVARELVAPFAQKLYSKARPATLSNAAMEVLSLIAYRQPITRVEIDEIRGVSSELMIKKLQARDLIETCGNKETVGRPLLYQVTKSFFNAFGLESLADLPACEAESLPESLFDGYEQPALSENDTDEAAGNTEKPDERQTAPENAAQKEAEPELSARTGENPLESEEKAGEQPKPDALHAASAESTRPEPAAESIVEADEQDAFVQEELFAVQLPEEAGESGILEAVLQENADEKPV